MRKAEESEAPPKYVSSVMEHSGLSQEHAKHYVKSIRPHRFMVDSKTFSGDIKKLHGSRKNPKKHQQHHLDLREKYTGTRR